MEERCPDRLTLSQDLSAAIATVYGIRREHEVAKVRKAPNTGALLVALSQAREAQRRGERAVREHIKQHGCKT
jgi:hypothetical protein